MGSLRNIAQLTRQDFDFLWLLAGVWEQRGFAPVAVRTRALVLGAAPSDDDAIALEVAASMTGVSLLAVPPQMESAADLDCLTPLAAFTIVWDAAGRFADFTARTAHPVLSLLGPDHDPVDVLAHLYRWHVTGRSMRGLRVLWDGPSAPALRSWIESTRALAISVTQVGGESAISASELAALRTSGQTGEFRQISKRPSAFDVDADEPYDLTTRVLTIAALLHRVAP